MTQLYVQVVNGEMAQCWDTTPPVPVGQDGWRNAIEIIPATIPYQQGLNGPVYDCTKDPVEIVWTTFDISVADRKSGLQGQNSGQFNQVVAYEAQTETDGNPNTHYNAQVVADAQTRYERINVQIIAATTQDQLDVIQQELDAFVPPSN
jgi:hypothetical protein